jgi:transcriptional regulator with XRE-family HTH domain
MKRKRIPNRLKKYRRIRGLRQRDVAAVLGLADSARISRWERGKCLPATTNLFKLAAVYRTMVDALYSDVLRETREDVRDKEHVVLKRRHSHDRLEKV